MRLALLIAGLLVTVPVAWGHEVEERGTIAASTPIQDSTGTYGALLQIASSSLPNGVATWRIDFVGGGESFTLSAGEKPPMPPLPAVPDFDIYFAGGTYENRAGDEAGVVPGDGRAVVVLFAGTPGEGFTYSER